MTQSLQAVDIVLHPGQEGGHAGHTQDDEIDPAHRMQTTRQLFHCIVVVVFVAVRRMSQDNGLHTGCRHHQGTRCRGMTQPGHGRDPHGEHATPQLCHEMHPELQGTVRFVVVLVVVVVVVGMVQSLTSTYTVIIVILEERPSTKDPRGCHQQGESQQASRNQDAIETKNGRMPYPYSRWW